MSAQKRTFRNCFTLVEVIVSMAVFAILMLGLMQFFASAQGLWSSTSNRVSTCEEARTAMSLLSTDLMCAYYEEGRTVGSVQDHRYFFIVQNPADNSASTGLSPALTGNRFKGIAFATLRSVKAHPEAATRLTEVFYRKNGNLLETKTVSDNQITATSPPWVTTTRSTVFTAFAQTPFAVLADTGYEGNASAANQTPESPTDGWTPLASNVVRFYVKVYPPRYASGAPSSLTFAQIFDPSGATAMTKFPGMVTVTIMSVDEDTSRKLKAMNPSVTVLENYLNTNNDDIASSYTSSPAGDLLREKMQIFTKTVYLDRGLN